MGKIADIAGEIEVTKEKLAGLEEQLADALGYDVRKHHGAPPAASNGKRGNRAGKFKATGVTAQVVRVLEREPRRVFGYGEILDLIHPKNRKSAGATIYTLGVNGRIKKVGTGKYKAAPAK